MALEHVKGKSSPLILSLSLHACT